MDANPLLGVFFHWLGGLSSASFYVPYKRIRAWSWEIFWITGGIFSWAIAPWLFASIQTHDLIGVLSRTPGDIWFWCWFGGAMWGLGGLTFGLTMRYLGLSLGMAVALGLTTVIGTMGPPIFRGTLGELFATTSGQTVFLGIAITLVGIVIVAQAGRRKEREMGATIAEADKSEFNLRKGLAIAVFSGIMSGCFAWGLDAGAPIRELTLQAGTDPLWQGLPVLCVVLLGGLTTTLSWCAILIARNRRVRQFVGEAAPGATEFQYLALFDV
ncbi:MAG: L-rhamnose/proton symporter RhaT, partial [Sphingopyxis sp.]